MTHSENRIKSVLVVGHPRSGSTYLIQYFPPASGAFTPNVNHQELFNVYEKLFNACALRLVVITSQETAERKWNIGRNKGSNRLSLIVCRPYSGRQRCFVTERGQT